MTKEELVNEAEDWLSITDNHLNDKRTHFLSESEYAEQAYLAGAEPREKRIAELEAQIAELKKQHDIVRNERNLFQERCEDILENYYCDHKCKCADLEKENAELKENLKTAYRKGMRHMAKALKDYDRTDGAWTDYFEHTVDKVLQREQLGFEEYGTLADQLTKAKDLLAKWVELFKPKLEGYPITPIQEQTEQFLSEVEK